MGRDRDFPIWFVILGLLFLLFDIAIIGVALYIVLHFAAKYW